MYPIEQPASDDLTAGSVPSVEDAIRFSMEHPENPQTYTHSSGVPARLPYNPHTPASRGIIGKFYRPVSTLTN